MSTQVVVSNDRYSLRNAITTVTDSTGPIARFPYDPTDSDSVTQRYLDFWRFSVARDIEVIEVIGDVI